jgi:hypothetical protein
VLEKDDEATGVAPTVKSEPEVLKGDENLKTHLTIRAFSKLAATSTRRLA